MSEAHRKSRFQPPRVHNKRPVGLGRVLTDARLLAGMSQLELSCKSGYSVCSISNWELGVAKPREQSLIDISEALNIEVPKGMV